jgi:hypothetical protein
VSRLSALDRPAVAERSVIADGGVEYGLAEVDGEPALVALAATADELAGLEGERSELDGQTLLVGPCGAANAAALRRQVAALRPRTLGVQGSVGLGDRLGLATPGHVRAVRASDAGLAPIFAQQSIRELDRLGREPGEVMDDATWGVLAEGWHEPFGADADHLKSVEHIDRCLPWGYTFFTIDPGDHVQGSAETAGPADLEAAVRELPWERLGDTASDLVARLTGSPLELEDRALAPTEEQVLRAAAKYGYAVAHVATMYAHLRERAPEDSFELEVSVDETETVTTHVEHVYIADTLTRLGVRWVSLAPRYVGRFEKGIDYIGDLGALHDDLAGHAAIAERLGPYKLSLHSGSDKFSAYPLAAEATAGQVHLKTSGTSYLEALRTAAEADPDLFRRIYALALDHFEEDRASYDLSVDAGALPVAGDVTDSDAPALLDDDPVRQVLHVTFGSVLGSELGDELRARLRAELREPYAQQLERHLGRHLRPFAEARAAREHAAA